MADFANLVLGVDTTGLKRGERALNDTTRAGVATERAVKGTGRGFDKAGRSASTATPKVAAFGAATDTTRAMALAATRALTAMVVSLGAVIVAGVGLNKFVDATVEADASQAQLAAAILSTGGAANRTLDQLNQHAAALQGVTNFGDEATNAMQGLLLTFTAIQGEVFNQATVAVLDLATAMGTDLNAAALQVGKALNDPVLGMTALSRSGIQFTQAQKDVVAAMVETNDIAGAQAIILAELEKQFGGSAEAARGTLGGALRSLGNAFGDLFEISNEGSAALRAAVESLIDTISDPKFIATIQSIGVAMFGMAEVAMKALSSLASIFQTLAQNVDILAISIGVLTASKLSALGTMAISTAASLLGLTGALTASAVAAGALAVAMNLIPFVAVVTGVTLLYRAYRDLGDTTGVTSAVTDILAGSVDALNVALETYSTSRSEAARQAAMDSARAMEADAVATLANVSAKLALLRVTAESNALFAESANQPGGLIYDLGLQVAEAERQLDNARRTMQGLARDAAIVATEVDAAATNGDAVAVAVGRVNFSNALSGANALAQSLGISLNLARQISIVAGSRGGEVFDPRSSIFSADAQASANRAKQLEDIRKSFEEIDLSLTAIGGGSGGSSGAAEDGLDAATEAADELAKAMDGQLKSGINGVSSAFGDFVAGGLQDFQGFVQSIIGSFKSMLSQMISLAARNRIMISLGMSGGGAGQALAGAAGGSGGAGGMLGGLMGSFGTGTGMAGLANGTGFLGGVGNVVGGIASGGLSGGFGAIGTALSGATSGLGGVAMAAGAVALPLLAVAGIFMAFRTKTKQLDAGIIATVTGMDTLVQSFNTVEKSRFFGLFKSVSTTISGASAATTDAITGVVDALQGGVLASADALGVAGDTFADFSHRMRVSTKGLSEEAASDKIQAALMGMADAMAGMVSGLDAFARDGEGAATTLERLALDLSTVNNVFRDLGFAAYNVSLAGADAASQFAGLFGSLQNFTAASSAYYDQFFTNDEKMANATSRLTESLAALGVNFVPDTRAGFRELVETAMLGGDSDLAANLIMLAPAFASVTEAANTLSDAILLSVNENAFATGVDFRRGLARAAGGIEYTPQQSQAEMLAELKALNARIDVLQSTSEITANSSSQTAENTDYSNALTLEAAT